MKPVTEIVSAAIQMAVDPIAQASTNRSKRALDPMDSITEVTKWGWSLSLLALSGHKLCTAVMVLMLVSARIKVLV